ncbi:MAG: hypothetical protein K2P92_03550, partial [Bdellovibrionaceae bacterium]|nr:hypothetical protein [Pseudobdellovibrionaceae bacterium]
MMKFVTLILLCFLSFDLQAQTIQVPEKCAGRTAPCIIKTLTEDYKFSYQGYDVNISPETIIKISTDKKHYNFDVLKGHLSLEKTKASAENTASIDTVMVDSDHVMASRDGASLQVLNLERFILSEYKIEGAAEAYAVRLKSDFASKTELISFAKNHFEKVVELRRFLSSVEKSWVAEFKRQNDLQTKALMRSVASE